MNAEAKAGKKICNSSYNFLRLRSHFFFADSQSNENEGAPTNYKPL